MIGANGELAWQRPTRPGDVLTVETEVLDVVPSTARQWRSVNISDIDSVIDEVMRELTTRPHVVLNLCDGDELNGIPGVSVIRALEKRKVCYSGANEYFYHLTTSKISMKRALDAALFLLRHGQSFHLTVQGRVAYSNDSALHSSLNQLLPPAAWDCPYAAWSLQSRKWINV